MNLQLGDKRFFGLILFVLFFTGETIQAVEPQVIYSFSRKENASYRREIVLKMMEQYSANQVFDTIDDYLKIQLESDSRIQPSATLIEGVFFKTQKLLNMARYFGGKGFNHQYHSDILAEKFRKYMRLKDVSFLLLGIKQEHKLIMAYLYLPEHESLRHEVFQYIVEFLFPQVPNVPENQEWFGRMTGDFEILVYDLFEL